MAPHDSANPRTVVGMFMRQEKRVNFSPPHRLSAAPAQLFSVHPAVHRDRADSVRINVNYT